MSRYSDCESCAFHGVEEAICDGCVEGDQWENDNTDDTSVFSIGAKGVHVAKFYCKRNQKAKETT